MRRNCRVWISRVIKISVWKWLGIIKIVTLKIITQIHVRTSTSSTGQRFDTWDIWWLDSLILCLISLSKSKWISWGTHDIFSEGLLRNNFGLTYSSFDFFIEKSLIQVANEWILFFLTKQVSHHLLRGIAKLIDDDFDNIVINFRLCLISTKDELFSTTMLLSLTLFPNDMAIRSS